MNEKQEIWTAASDYVMAKQACATFEATMEKSAWGYGAEQYNANKPVRTTQDQIAAARAQEEAAKKHTRSEYERLLEAKNNARAAYDQRVQNANNYYKTKVDTGETGWAHPLNTIASWWTNLRHAPGMMNHANKVQEASDAYSKAQSDYDKFMDQAKKNHISFDAPPVANTAIQQNPQQNLRPRFRYNSVTIQGRNVAPQLPPPPQQAEAPKTTYL